MSPKRMGQLPLMRDSQEAWISRHCTVVIPGIANIDKVIELIVDGSTACYTLRQILCTVWQEDDNERPLYKQIHSKPSTHEFFGITHLDNVAQATNFASYSPVILQHRFGRAIRGWYKHSFLRQLEGYVYDEDTQQIVRNDEQDEQDEDFEFIREFLDNDDDVAQSFQQYSAQPEIKICIEGMLDLEQGQGDDDFDANRSIGSLATGTSNVTQQINNLQQDDDTEVSQSNNSFTGSTTTNNHHGTDSSPEAKTPVQEKNE